MVTDPERRLEDRVLALVRPVMLAALGADFGDQSALLEHAQGSADAADR
jgi:hypothetical protein